MFELDWSLKRIFKTLNPNLIMKKIYGILGVLLILLLTMVGAFYFYNQNKAAEPIGEIDVTKLMYYGTNISIGEKVVNVWQNRTDFLFEKDGKFYCLNSEKETLILSYPSPYQCAGEILPGCGGLREALICGEIYFIYDFSSSWGPRMYGPFNLTE